MTIEKCIPNVVVVGKLQSPLMRPEIPFGTLEILFSPKSFFRMQASLPSQTKCVQALNEILDKK